MTTQLAIVCALIIALAIFIAHIVERDMQAAHPHAAAPGMMFVVITSFGVAVSIAVALLGGLMGALA